MIKGFIYEWFDKTTGLKYIGRHEGDCNDDYVGSGTIFLKEYYSRISDFSRTILWESHNISVSELKQKEEEFLSAILDDELYYGSNRKYYNQVKNSSGYTSENNPMKIPEVVQRMVETQKKRRIKDPWQNRVAKYGYEKACAMNANFGNTNGSGNKGKPKTEEHKAKIAANRKGGTPKGWRKSKEE